jgi:hypothetical protein
MAKGGRREGAGRKPKPFEERKVKLTIGFEPLVANWLRSQKNYNRLVNELLQRQIQGENMTRATIDLESTENVEIDFDEIPLELPTLQEIAEFEAVYHAELIEALEALK